MQLRLVAALMLVSPFVSHAAGAGDWTLGKTAMLVEESDEKIVDAALSEALESSDPAVRAIAARVITVRNRKELLPRVEALLSSEANPEAARELIRAAIIVGGTKDIDEALGVSERFGHRLDTTVAVATARLGAAAAFSAYRTKFAGLKIAPKSNFFLIALWGAPEAVPSTAAWILSSGDERAWRSFMDAVEESEISLDADNYRAALSDPLETIRTTTIDALLNGYSKKTQFADDVKAVFREPTGTTAEPPYLAFKRELVRRIGGAAPRAADAWLPWIHHQEISEYFERRPALLDFFLPAERAAMVPPREKLRQLGKPSIRMVEVLPPQFYMPDVLPDGVADGILSSTRCSSEWIGLGEMSVDRAGRVVTLDVSKVDTSSNCKTAVDAITRLALVHPTSITSRFETKYAVFVRPAGKSLCIDEGPVPSSEEVDFEACNPFHVGGDSPCVPPVVRKSFAPRVNGLSRILSGGDAIVIVEAMITQSGCVRSGRLVVQSPIGELNRAALLALLRWKFKPASIGGVSVPAVFNLTIHFRSD